MKRFLAIVVAAGLVGAFGCTKLEPKEEAAEQKAPAVEEKAPAAPAPVEEVVPAEEVNEEAAPEKADE